MRWRFFLACLGVAVVALVAQVVVGCCCRSRRGRPSGGVNEFTARTRPAALIVLLTTPFQAAGEEYFFRGYLLRPSGRCSATSGWRSSVTAVLFALAHGMQNLPLFFDRFMFGLIAGWLVVRTGGLEAGIAMHVLNNFLAFGIALTFGDLADDR